MKSFCRNAAIAPNLVLAIILVAAQAVVATHAFDHDTGNSQNQTCTTCVAASQLGSATVDTGGVWVSIGLDFDPEIIAVNDFRSTHTLVSRQRGPPLSL
jgi:hypothetical protein